MTGPYHFGDTLVEDGVAGVYRPGEAFLVTRPS
jgi:hypothetical protein